MKILKIIFLFLSFTLIFYFKSNSQNFGGHPKFVHFKQIKDSTATIIFDRRFSNIGNRTSQYIHQLAIKDSLSIMNLHGQRIPIVLQNFQTISNGYVALAPFRSEFYLIQPPNPFNLGASSFLHTLSTHEFRHVQQFKALNRSWIKLFSVLGGGYGRSFKMFVSLPNWYFEGDAVTQETQYSSQGRGNQPLFFAGFKALAIEHKQYTYRRLRNGSYIQYIPNHYPLGYLLVNYGYEKYGNDFWDKVVLQAPRSLISFNHTIKKVSGIKLKTFVKEGLAFYNNQWKNDHYSANFISPLARKDVFNYQQPYFLNQENIVLLKESYSAIPQFITFNTTTFREQKIIQANYTIDDYYSFNKNSIVYSSFQQDPRWNNLQYNNIYTYDLRTKKGKFISKKSTYFMPDVAHHSETYIAVNQGRDLSSTLDLLNEKGQVIRQYSFGKNQYYYYPKFSNNDSFCFVSIAQGDSMSLVKFNLYSNTALQTIIPFSKRVIGYLNVQGDSLSFSTTYQKVDELWMWKEQDNSVKRIASEPTAIYQGVWQKERLLGTVFTASGYRLGELKPIQTIPQIQDELKPLYLTDLSRFPQQNLAFSQQANFKQTNYRKTHGWFRFHSWFVEVQNPNITLTIAGQNTLNTVQSNIVYQYNQYEGFHKLGYEFFYGGTYIVPVVSIEQIWNRSFNVVDNGRNLLLTYDQFNFSGGGLIPLVWIKNKFIQRFSVQSQINYSLYKPSQDFSFNNAAPLSILNVIRYSNQQYLAAQNFAPRWGQSYSLYYQKGLDNYASKGFQINANANFYFPGIAKNHSLFLQFNSQYRDTFNVIGFSNLQRFARGYVALNFPVMFTGNLNYQLPIAYPNWGSELVYLRRIRLNLYYDHSYTYSLRNKTQINLNSVGAEVYFDINFYGNVIFPIGVGYSYQLNANTAYYQNSFYLIIPSLF